MRKLTTQTKQNHSYLLKLDDPMYIPKPAKAFEDCTVQELIEHISRITNVWKDLFDKQNKQLSSLRNDLDISESKYKILYAAKGMHVPEELENKIDELQEKIDYIKTVVIEFADQVKDM